MLFSTRNFRFSFHALGLRAVHDRDVLAAKFEHQIEIFARMGEIGDQALDRPVEADEHHAAVAFGARHRLKAERVAVEGRRVGVIAWASWDRLSGA